MDKSDWFLLLTISIAFVTVIYIWYRRYVYVPDDFPTIQEYLENQSRHAKYPEPLDAAKPGIWDYPSQQLSLDRDYSNLPFESMAEHYAKYAPRSMPSGYPVGSYYFVGSGTNQNPIPDQLVELESALSKSCSYCGTKIFSGERECCKCGAPIRG